MKCRMKARRGTVECNTTTQSSSEPASAGPPLAGRLTAAGMKVAIIERRLFGGTCVNTGCTPTKAMIASAYAAQLARRAAEYRVVIGSTIDVDMKAVKARKDAIVEQSRTWIETSLKAMKNCAVYEDRPGLNRKKKSEWGAKCSAPIASSST